MQTATNTPAVFNFDSHAVRTLLLDDAPWFVAADVCAALTLTNSRMVLERLDDDEKGVSSTDTPGGKQELAVINESGLYNLILGSRKPEAKRFKKWVTSEVLPAIRKTGRYDSTVQPAPALPQYISQEQYDLLVKTMNSRSISRYWQRNVWKALSVRFNIERLRQLPAADFNAACAFILNEPLPKSSVRKLAAPKTSAAKVLSLAAPVDIRAKRAQQALAVIKGSTFKLSVVELPNGNLIPDLQYVGEGGFVVSSMNSIDQILDRAGLVAVPKEALQGFAGALKRLSV